MSVVRVELAPRLPAAQLEPLERYHAAIEAAARTLSADERRAAGQFLEAVADRAGATTERLRKRGRVSSRKKERGRGTT